MPTFSSRLVLSTLLGVLGLCGCGGVSRVDRPGFGNETAGGGSLGGADNGGRGGEEVAGNSVGGSSAAGAGAAGASAAGASACSPFRDEGPQSIPVMLRNDTAVPIYLGPRMQTCGVAPLYSVLNGTDEPLLERGPCGSSCQSYLDGNPSGGCPAVCLLPSVTKLAPGEAITTDWSGLYARDVQLPTACDALHSPGKGSASCSVNQRVEPGDYTVVASAGSAFLCNGIPNGCSDCAPATTGGCTINGAIVAGAESSVVQNVHLEATDNGVIELIFRPAL